MQGKTISMHIDFWNDEKLFKNFGCHGIRYFIERTGNPDIQSGIAMHSV